MSGDLESRPGGRIPFARAGELARAVLRRGTALFVGGDLTGQDFRVLVAVVIRTATYSRRGDRVYLGQIAADAYGVERALPWHLDKTKKSLGKLARAGLIERRAPMGRPPEGLGGPAYWVALRHQSAAAEGPISTEGSGAADGHTSRVESEAAVGREVGPSRAKKWGHAEQISEAVDGSPREKTPEEVLLGEVFETARAKAHATANARWAADRLTALAPADEGDTAQRCADAAVRLVGPQLVNDALDEIEPYATAKRHPAELLALIAFWLTEHDHPAAARLEQLADVLVDYPQVVILADATSYKTRRHWTEHTTEAGEVLDHWQRHNYPSGVIARALNRARADGLRRPAHADRIAHEELAALGLSAPKYTAAAAMKTCRTT